MVMKNIGEKVLGWFVVAEDEAPAPGAAAPPGPRPTPVAAPPVVAPGNDHDAKAFAEVYRAAGLADADRLRVAKVLDLLAALPDAAAPEVKRAIVVASLEAFGVSIDGVVAAAGAADGALDSYALDGRRRTEQVLAEAQARVADLEAKIAEAKRLVDLQLRAQEELAKSVARERARIRAIGAFFGE
jgi:hypothetical protein